MTSLDDVGSGDGSGSHEAFDVMTTTTTTTAIKTNKLDQNDIIDLSAEFLLAETPKRRTYSAALDQSELDIDLSAFPLPGFASVVLGSETGDSCFQSISTHFNRDAAKAKHLFLTDLFRSDTTFLSREEILRFLHSYTSHHKNVSHNTCGRLRHSSDVTPTTPSSTNSPTDAIEEDFSGDESSGDSDVIRDQTRSDDVTLLYPPFIGPPLRRAPRRKRSRSDTTSRRTNSRHHEPQLFDEISKTDPD